MHEHDLQVLREHSKCRFEATSFYHVLEDCPFIHQVLRKFLQRSPEILGSVNVFPEVLLVERDEIMHDELDKEGISIQDFRITSHPELSSSGTYRVIASRPVDLLVNNGILDFKLGRGMYATSYLREIMKENMDRR